MEREDEEGRKSGRRGKREDGRAVIDGNREKEPSNELGKALYLTHKDAGTADVLLGVNLMPGLRKSIRLSGALGFAVLNYER